ncbi:hypothetical protein AVEN_214232-1 [Araneus ventricosus]|uniref:Uncharacterized protein n=1 Tax=Araneus ventricosus TaxID=182803 RepID=A0A4Y2U5K4_ARAVE|nr:hypothetical protein AVEN_214232-1 [Araneus ventricosus]
MGSQRCWNLLDISISRVETLECTRRFHVMSRPAAGDMDDGVCVDRLGTRTSLEFYPLCELLSKELSSQGLAFDFHGDWAPVQVQNLELRPDFQSSPISRIEIRIKSELA